MSKTFVTFRRGDMNEPNSGAEPISRHVAHFRRLMDGAGGLTRAAAEALFELDRDHRPAGEEWRAFFVETITDYVVWQVRPTGTVTSEMADWLLTQADSCRTLNAFALLVNVLIEAHRVPASLPGAVRERAAAWPCVPEALRWAQVDAA